MRTVPLIVARVVVVVDKIPPEEIVPKGVPVGIEAIGLAGIFQKISGIDKAVAIAVG